MTNDILPRLASRRLEQSLRVMPVTVVSGARQTGKSTLAQQLSGPRRYISLDDLDARAAAREEPALLLDGAAPITLDEIQREPGLLHAVKQTVDQRRQPGHFLLTGSANLLLMHRVAESLAGRASYLTLWPMTRREQLGLGVGGVWEQLLAADPQDWMALLQSAASEPEDWRALARRGGFPTPARQLEHDDDRAIWFDGYVRTYLERDLQDLANISALPDYRRLMRAVCQRLGQMLNQTGLSRDLSISQPTVGRYLSLLETSYLLVRLPAYSVNRSKRLIKTPKAYWADTGVALYLSQETEPTGAHLENIVLHDLLAWRDSRAAHVELFYWRTTVGDEVDLVVEANGRLLPIEIKSGRRPRLRDAKHLHTFIAEYTNLSYPGLLLHDGEELHWITANVLAAPWWMVV